VVDTAGTVPAQVITVKTATQTAHQNSAAVVAAVDPVETGRQTTTVETAGTVPMAL